MRELYNEGQWVIVIKTGKKYQVDYDYEDLIYVKGIKEPFQPNQIKKA